MAIEVRKWAPGTPGTVAFHVSDLLNDINARLGLKLDKSDLASDPWINPTTDHYYTAATSLNTVTIASTSKAYIGTFQIRWVNGERNLESLVPLQEISGREFPGGNVFDSDHKEILNTLTYSLDITSVFVNYASVFFNSPRVQGNYLAHQGLFNFINNECGTAYTADVDNIGQVGNLYNAFMVKYELPADLALVPEAKSTYYNRVLVITPNESQQALWCTGKMLLHFNE